MRFFNAHVVIIAPHVTVVFSKEYIRCQYSIVSEAYENRTVWFVVHTLNFVPHALFNMSTNELAMAITSVGGHAINTIIL